MKERPILFNSEMVQAVLDGRKTQTRRVVKVPKSLIQDTIEQKPPYWKLPMAICEKTGCFADVKSPYGKAGGELWVRETFAIECNAGFQDSYRYPEDPLGPVVMSKGPEGCEYFECPRYRASEPDTVLGDDGIMRWKPSIFMPRWASRIQLAIKDIRVESVQDISEDDAISEGVIVVNDTPGPIYKAPNYPNGCTYATAKQAFKTLWDSINKERGYSWKTNPWVWVVEFEVLKNGKLCG